MLNFLRWRNVIMNMKKPILAAAALLGIAGITAVALKAQDKPLETVPKVDLEKYLGKWYEIAAFPQSFQKGCSCTSAVYGLRPDGNIEVTNTCVKEGKIKKAIGKAVVKDKKTNAKLSVQFFWPFSGKYWIIALAPDYSYAVVGHPNRDYLWILSRKPVMDDQTYRMLLVQVAEKGFDIRKLVKTDQSCNN